MWLRRIFLVLFAVVVGGAKGATITSVPLEAVDTSLVTITGSFEPDDADQFKTKTASIPKAIVLLESDGGNLVAGLQIGEAIRLKNYISVVPDGVRCASACALAWLGGTKRLMGKGAQIGFHSAYDASTGTISGAGDALIGAYLNKIGLPERAIVFLTSPAPSEIQWLNVDDARKVGIDVEIFTLPTNSAPAPSATPQPSSAPVVSNTETSMLNTDQLETAGRLARNFYVRYKAAGTAGLSQSIQSCYSQTVTKRKFTSIVYCIALDNLTSDIDKEVTTRLKVAQIDFYKIENVRVRAVAAVSACEMQNLAPQIFKLASAIDRQATIDLEKISTQPSSPQAPTPVAVAPRSPPTALNSADINVSCSRQADALGLHGLARKGFRERCKAQSPPAE